MKIQVFRNSTHKGLMKALMILLCTVYIAGCSTAISSAPVTEPVQEKGSPQVKVEAVGKHSMGDPREQIAEIHASARIEILVEASGSLVMLSKKSGEMVKAGEVIGKIQSRNAVIEKEKAEIALKTAELSLVASKDVEATTRLDLMNTVNKLKDGLKQQVRDGASETELEETRRNLQAAMTKLEAHDGNNTIAIEEGKVETARLLLEQTEQAWNGGQIVSPATGVLGDVKLTEGMNIQAGSTLGVVQKTDTVLIKAMLTESSVKLIGNKKELKFVDSNSIGKERTAKVIRVSDVPDATTRLYTVELEAKNTDDSLKPLTRVHIQLTTPEEETVVAVPSLSILREDRSTYVFVLNGNKAEKREVQLGRVSGPYQEVRSGLKKGEQLVVSGQHTLVSGQVVQVVKE